VGRRLHDRLRPLAFAGPLKLRLTPPNPLRSEADAFGFLLWFVALVVVILAIVGIIEVL
jgi:hypothetical protein